MCRRSTLPARNRGAAVLALTLALQGFVGPATSAAQAPLPSPEAHFGHPVGADYILLTYSQLLDYWQVLARGSDRMVLDTIGPTSDGRPQVMAILTSPENHRNLERYREIARRLALAEDVETEEEARALAAQGKAVVWIDGGLHATEVVGTQQLIEHVWQMVSRNDPETLRFLDDAIILSPLANPDGMELVSSWYMRNPDPLARSYDGLPELYHRYAGHDNNRDFYMVNLVETENLNRIAYREWFPQIMYNHHQTGPQGQMVFIPPFRGPPNPNMDPMIIAGIGEVGMAMHNRLLSEGKMGSGMGNRANYSLWWNGGLRTTPYYKNVIGILTEIKGHPTPQEFPFIPDRQLFTELQFPREPGPLHFRESIEYSMSQNRAVMDYASRNRERLLFNVWRMARNSIERGSRDHWTTQASRVYAAAEATGGLQQRGTVAQFQEHFRRPADRDARGYILSADQADFATATKFVNVLIKGGVTVHQADATFMVAGKQYPAGSYVVKTAQAYRPHILDMFEPQDHPDDFLYPGGPPIPPYDATGYTVALQMGVQFDRILDGFDGPFREIEGMAAPRPGRVADASGATGFLLDRGVNDAVRIVNRALAAGGQVGQLQAAVTVNGRSWPAGTLYVGAGNGVAGQIGAWAAELGVDAHGVPSAPSNLQALQPVRVGLADPYSGSMPSGWTRFILENFDFPFEVVYPSRLNEGNLRRDFDVLLFPDGVVPSTVDVLPAIPLEEVPDSLQHRWGVISVDETVGHVLDFVRQGGTVVAVGSSTNLAAHAGLPVESHLVGDDGRPLSREVYFVPESILEVRVDNTLPVAFGMDERVDVLFGNDPVFRLLPGAESQGVRPIAWFDSAAPLRSGWAWGQERLEGGVAALEATVGQGKMFLFGPQVTFRAQPHGTFPFLFNGILDAATRPRSVF